MSKKWLFFVIIIILFVSSIEVNAYDFETKEEFVGFLGDANEQGLDLRQDVDQSLEIMDYAEEFNVDLNYYQNVLLYNSIFSPFSWWLTGFSIFESGNGLTLDQEEYYVGEKVEVNINQDLISVDKIALLIDGELVVAFPKQVGMKSVEFKIPELEPGKYEIQIKGTPISKTIKIKGVEFVKDPLLVVDKKTVESGENIILKGVNFPVKEIGLEDESGLLGQEEIKNLDSLEIFADNILIAVVSYPVKGVFEAEAQTSLLKPGNYLINVKNYPTASTVINVVTPYIEPRIKISNNVLVNGDVLEISGYNFEDGAGLSIMGDNSLEKLVDLKINNGEFHKLFPIQDMLGKYTIVYTQNSGIFVSFKVIEEEQLQKITFKDNSVERGQDLVIEGEGFEENKKIALIREGEQFQKIVVDCDEWGRFEESVNTDNYPVGKQRIYLQSNSDIENYFNIEKEKPLSEIIFDSKVYVSEDFIVSGINFYDNEIVYLYANNLKIGNVKIIDNKFEFNVDNNLALGNYKLAVKDSNVGILAIGALDIIRKDKPVVKIITEDIYPDSVFKIQGFYLDGNVRIFVENSLISEAKVDNLGGFSKKIDLSGFDLMPGPYKLLLKYDNGEEIVAVTAMEIKSHLPDPELIIVEPTEIIFGDDFKIKGTGFDDDVESIVLSLDNEVEYVVYPVGGNFVIELNSVKLGGGYHKIFSEKYGVGKAFIIIEKIPPALELNSTLNIGQDLHVQGSNFENGDTSISIDEVFVSGIVIENNTFTEIIDTSRFTEGYHILDVNGVSAGFNLKKELVVNPGIKLSDSTAGPGLLMGINGFNFPKLALTSTLEILLDGEKILDIGYSGDGNFDATDMILNMENGEHTISVKNYPTAIVKFIYDGSASSELSMKVYDQEFLPGQEISGLVNGLNVGMNNKLNVVLNSKPYDEIQSKLGSATFSFGAPELSEGTYYLGLAGHNDKLVQIKILAKPEKQEVEDYSDEEVKELTKEVQEKVSGVVEKETEELDEAVFDEFVNLQNRILGGVAAGLVEPTCVPSCENKCGQSDGCAGKCSSKNVRVAGECGNSLKENKVNEVTAQISEPVSDALIKYIFFNEDRTGYNDKIE